MVACQPRAPAAALSFTAPHMVLQCWVPGGLLALHHPGPGSATRPLLPPVSPLHWGPDQASTRGHHPHNPVFIHRGLSFMPESNGRKIFMNLS